MACLETIPGGTTPDGSGSPDKPRRNLTQAFEALCVDSDSAVQASPHAMLSPSTSVATSVKLIESSLISPTGVTDVLPRGGPKTNKTTQQKPDRVPVLKLHADLKKELSDSLVQRVSCYSLIHDINKEATSLASHDPLNGGGGGAAAVAPSSNSAQDDDSPLVQAVLHRQKLVRTSRANPVPTLTIVDEEEWLLETVSARTQEETAHAIGHQCPATFLQAMGEQEYESPAPSAVIGSTRTQLWKPSRSWWEAKSGKNPWIEPSSHNKRWRYLWPLIHYHKFLAKCIKKLKRNSVDVKQSVSPVAVFLRDEVCAVSDHLASVSLFGSDEWMAALKHFHGWIDLSEEAEKSYQQYVATLRLRALLEPGDVDSPLLRSQIDEHFLRSMVAQREQMRDAVPVTSNKSSNRSTNSSQATNGQAMGGAPPMYPRGHQHPNNATDRTVQSGQQGPNQLPVPKHIHGIRRPRFYSQGPPPSWWNSGWDVQAGMQPCLGDANSVHSGLSSDSFPQPAGYEYGMYPMPHYFGVPTPAHPPPGYSSDNSQSSGGYNYNGMNTNLYENPQWVDPIPIAYSVQQPIPQAPMGGYYGHPMTASTAPVSPDMYHPSGLHSSPRMEESAENSVESPYRCVLESNMQSPYWAHLDQATMAMGLATPARSSPSTPSRQKKREEKRDDQDFDSSENEDKDVVGAYINNVSGFASTAQPPLLRQQYYGYAAYGARDNYGPISPATQFMMSPQASFAYNYGYGFSPRRPSSRSTPRSSNRGGGHVGGSGEKTPPAGHHHNSRHSRTPSISERKDTTDRESPSTVETSTETESMHDQTTL